MRSKTSDTPTSYILFHWLLTQTFILFVKRVKKVQQLNVCHLMWISCKCLFNTFVKHKSIWKINSIYSQFICNSDKPWSWDKAVERLRFNLHPEFIVHLKLIFRSYWRESKAENQSETCCGALRRCRAVKWFMVCDLRDDD